jgi:hypothetical protein
MSTPETTTDLVLHDGRKVPATQDLARLLKLGLLQVVAEERDGKTFETPEDVFAAVRRLGTMEETAKSYGRAFTGFSGEVRKEIAEFLVDAVGEQDGVPTSGLTVPDADGTDLKVSRDTKNEYDIDRDSLKSALAFSIMKQYDNMIAEMFRAEFDGRGDDAQTMLAEVLTEAMQMYADQGKYEPQVTKVTATAKLLARLPGGDKISAIVMGAIKKRTIFKGVTVERVQPKATK